MRFVSTGRRRGAWRAAWLPLAFGWVCGGLLGAAAATGSDDPPASPPAPTGLTALDFHATDAQLRDLIDGLLRGSPELAVANAVALAGSARALHGRALPDPVLRYTWWASPPETRVGPQRHTFELSQTLPWKGKRRAGVAGAELDAAGAALDVDARARALVTALKAAYFDAAYLHEALLLNAEERELLERFESVALKRYATGQGIQQSVIKVQTDLTRLEDARAELRQRLDVAWSRVAELVGRAGSDLGVRHAALEAPAALLDREAIVSEAGRLHPAVLAVEVRMAAADAGVRGGKLRSRPDFTVGLGWSIVDKRRDAAGTALPPENNGQDILGLRVGLNLPIWKQHARASVGEAEARRDGERQALAATRNRLQAEAEAAALRFTTLDRRRRLYAEVLIPQARESLGSAEAAYASNRIGFLDLLDAERVLFEVRRTYQRLISDGWTALAEIEHALGRPYPAPDAAPQGGE